MTRECSVDGLDRLQADILQIFCRLLESLDLSIDDDFFDKGGDSLLATELMLELRRLTGKAIPDSLLFESSTIRALAERLNEKETPRPNVAVRVGAASEAVTPLLFFHGDWTSGGFYVEHLARKLGQEISLIAVAPHGAGDEPIPASIEDMAADRLPAILAAQPTGPYRLAGHCVGGIVAFETARLLMKLNRRVEMVVLIDSPLVIGGEAMKMPQGASVRAEAREPAAASDIPIRPPTPFGRGFEIYTERLAAYSPIPLPVRLFVLAAEYDGRGWAQLSEDAELVEIPGDHFDLVTSRIDEFAARLRSWVSGDPSPSLDNPAERPSLAGDKADQVLARREDDRESPARRTGAAKHDFLSRNLRRLFPHSRP